MCRATSNIHPKRPQGNGVRRALGVTVGLLFLARSAAAAPQLHLRHQLTPGSVSTYDVRVETQPPNAITGVLTRAIFRDDPNDSAMCAQILTTRQRAQPPAQTQPASKPPHLGNVPDRVQLAVRRISAAHSEYLVPTESKRLQQLLPVITDVLHWLDCAVSVGDTWSRPFAVGSTEGRHRYQFNAIERQGVDQLAKVTVITSFDADAEFDRDRILSARSDLVWSISDRELISLDGRLTYRTPPAAGNEEGFVRITMRRVRNRRWTQHRRADEREALIEITRAVAAYRLDDESQVTRICERFLRQRRTSIFRPLAMYLDQQIRARREPLPIDELKQRLVDLLAEWHQTETEDDIEKREQLKRDFARLMEVNRSEIVRLLDDESAEFRAVACFAMAFGKTPADIARMQVSCRDPNARVRQWAMAALAMRGSILTSQDVLMAGLGDSDATVRRRACQAIEVCTPKDSPDTPQAITALADRLNDESADVVYAAAQALMRLGGPSQSERIRSAAEKCADPHLAAALHRLLMPTTRPGS